MSSFGILIPLLIFFWKQYHPHHLRLFSGHPVAPQHHKMHGKRVSSSCSKYNESGIRPWKEAQGKNESIKAMATKAGFAQAKYQDSTKGCSSDKNSH